MNHDPMCTWQDFTAVDCHECELIAKVRADEATAWVNGVELNSYRRALRDAIAAVAPITVDFGGMPQAEKVMSALRGLLGEQQ